MSLPLVLLRVHTINAIHAINAIYTIDTIHAINAIHAKAINFSKNDK
jgi:hypothetical protein